MTVPFDQIGAGQSGRLVYQVMGKDGPIFNPDNIRYLGPEEAQQAGLVASKGGDLVGLAAGLAGVNLMVSIGSLALSAAILKEVREISAKLDSLRALSIETARQLDSVSQRLNIIDIKVSENNLRHALNHVASTCIRDNTIDLVEIKKLENDLEIFMNGVDDYGYGSNGHFRLSSDVKDKLTGLHSFLFRVRETVAKRHNLKAGGDPFRMLTMNPIQDYMPTIQWGSGCLKSPVIMMALQDDLTEHANEVSQAVHDRFTFSEETDKQAVFEHVMAFGDRIWTRYMEIDHHSGNMFNGLYELLQKSDEALDNEGMLTILNDWENFWLLKTDMGLVWRTYFELLAIGDYAAVFRHWTVPQTKPLGSDCLLVDCTWKRAS